MQLAAIVRLAQRMKSRFVLTVLCILQQQQRLVEEDLLRLRCGNPVFLILAGIATILNRPGFRGGHLV